MLFYPILRPSVTDPLASVFSLGFSLEKTPPGRQIFRHTGCPFTSGLCFAFFKHTQMIYAGYVKVAPGRPQALKISPGIRVAKFSLDKG